MGNCNPDLEAVGLEISTEFFTEDIITTASEELHNFGRCSVPMSFEQGGIFIQPHLS